MVETKNNNIETAVSKLSKAEKALLTKELAAAKLHGAEIANVGRTHLMAFLDFVREQGVIGLAVGLALGTAAGASVKQIVDGLINPIVGFLIGGIDLAQLKWIVVAPGSGGRGGLVFSWGAVISSLITLLATALVIYWLVRVTKLDRIDKKKDV